MKKTLALVTLSLFASFTFAQIYWSENAAQVFYDNCTSCHNANGIGPFALLDYENAFIHKDAIKYVVEDNEMPPWTADTSYQSYFHERVLSEDERAIIINWVNDGALEGNPAAAPPPPVYNNEQVISGIPDLVVEMPLYMSKATASSDDYICIALPTGLSTDKKIKAIEIIPGNRPIVHHCLVFKDPTASYITDTIGGNCGGPSIGDLIGGYTPGASPTIFPSSETFATGITLEAGSNIILALHYPEGSFGEYDQTKVNFYFYPDPVENFRDVFAERLIENWFFFLAANQLTEVQDTYVVNSNDLTMMSVFPHMHLLGSSIESYAVSPMNDTIPLIRINEWDFEWQDFYFFKYLQHIPSGSIFYGKGIYDNTAANPNNPNSPPIDVFPGLNTTDEMFLFYFHYMLYETGDELINVDSLNSIWLAGQTSNINTAVLDKYKLKTYPNPFTENTTIEFTLNEPASVNIYIYDVQGMLVKKIGRINQAQGVQNFIWDGSNSEGAQVPSGLYYGSMLINGEAIPIKLIRK